MTADPAPPGSQIDWIDGQPVSKRFGDVFFSRESGIEETEHVFLRGNRLAERWRALTSDALFVIGETGFGTGLNFLAAWRLWNETAPPGARLHVVSIERYPLARGDLEQALHLWPQLEREAHLLVEAWDDFAQGWHRLDFDGGRVALTLAVADARDALERLELAADAWFLDGFAPAKNPDMWTPDLLRAVASRSAPGATFSTYTAAGDVRRGLEAAGFAVRKERGFGAKREMLVGELVAPPPKLWSPPWYARPRPAAGKDVIVIGAGLAGAAAAHALAIRGRRVTIIDRHDRIAAEASGNPQGILYARLSGHATVLRSLVLAGYQHSVRALKALADNAIERGACGVLQIAFDDAERERQARLASEGYPRRLLRAVTSDEASELAGMPVESDGLWFETGQWVHPPALCEHLLAHPGISLQLGAGVARLSHQDGRWLVYGEHGVLGAAETVIVAGAMDATALAQTSHLPLRAIRGQITAVPATSASSRLRAAVCGEGYVAPARLNVHTLGATHKFNDPSTALHPDEHAENLATLARLMPSLHAALKAESLDPASLGGRAAHRCSSPDYIPIVGPVVDAAEFRSRYAALTRDATAELAAPAPWMEGLYVDTAHGSRGLVTAPLAGDILASILCGEPAPVPREILDALHPSRFLVRALRRANARTATTR